MEQILAKYTQAKQNIKASTAITDRIYSFIELNNDGSLVIFGGNQIKHMGTGKESGKTIKNLMTGKNKTMAGKPIKITVTSSRLYETDCGRNPDMRVDMIIKKEIALVNYRAALSFRADEKASEEQAKKGQGPPKFDAESQIAERIAEAKKSLAVAEDIGDKELIEMAKSEIKAAQSPANERMTKQEFEEMKILVEESKRKAKEQVEKFERESKPLLDAPLPSYTSPSEADAL
jgi:hypothetical protein